MELARVFCPPPQRGLFDLWGALLHQLDEAAFELSDANVARTKLAWWGEELATMGSRTARHPLARALSGHDAVREVPAHDWHALAHAAMLAAASEHAPADTAALLAQGAPFARASARVEAQVFAASPSGALVSAGATPVDGALPEPIVTPSAHADAIAVHQVLRRLEHSLGRDAAQFPWPMHLRARHQASPGAIADLGADPAAGAALADLANDLLAPVATLRGGPLFRRCQAALDGQRLRQLARRRLERLRANGASTLWTLWRAARRGA